VQKVRYSRSKLCIIATLKKTALVIIADPGPLTSHLKPPISLASRDLSSFQSTKNIIIKEISKT